MHTELIIYLRREPELHSRQRGGQEIAPITNAKLSYEQDRCCLVWLLSTQMKYH